jgi:hypothetical protein
MKFGNSMVKELKKDINVDDLSDLEDCFACAEDESSEECAEDESSEELNELEADMACY